MIESDLTNVKTFKYRVFFYSTAQQDNYKNS